MGARSSTPRTVQIENESSVNVIEVSDAVVDRLKGIHTKGLYDFATIVVDNLRKCFYLECLCNHRS